MAKPTTSISVRVISNRIPSLPSTVKTDTSTEVKRAAFDVEALGKAKAPVRTGTLRRSITTQIDEGGMRAVVGPSVDYGIYVELGTRHMAARPYMRPAAEAVMPHYVDRIKFALRKLP